MSLSPILSLKLFLRQVVTNRYLIYQLTRRDFKNRYIGSVFGLLWAFVQPLALMSILWFVFSCGLKAQSAIPGIPFVAWFFSAMVAWNFFADVAIVNTNVLAEYAFMLKKIEFRMSILPIIKILSSLFIHLIFVLILCIILICNGIRPNWHWLQFVYYTCALMYLMLGMGWLTAALNVFVKDTLQVMNIIIQFGFWVTPVIWNVENLPASYRPFLKLNPIFYITEGYRNCFIYNKPLWETSPALTAYFWIFSTFIVLSGFFVFRKLRPHFGDVI